MNTRLLLVGMIAASPWSAHAQFRAGPEDTSVVHLPKQQIDSVIAEISLGGPAFRQVVVQGGTEYFVVRRLGRGEADVHELQGDLAFVYSGMGTVTTGGVLEGKRSEIAPRDWRAPAIRGGQMRDVRRGDIVFIPAGKPHQWASSDDEPLVYVVLKVARSVVTPPRPAATDVEGGDDRPRDRARRPDRQR